MDSAIENKKASTLQAVVTRSTSSPIHPFILSKLDHIYVDHVKFKNLQQRCASLVKVRKLTDDGASITMRDGSECKFTVYGDLLYRRCTKSNSSRQLGKQALIGPAQCRKVVPSASHESHLAGHFGHRKTDLRLREKIFWPSVTEDVRNYSFSCDVCHRTGRKGRVSKVSLEPMPIVTEPLILYATSFMLAETCYVNHPMFCL